MTINLLRRPAFLVCSMWTAWISIACAECLFAAETNIESIERWGLFELSLPGPESGNPFVDVAFSAEFRQDDRVFAPRGFYDGQGVYRVRFMPDRPGSWSYRTRSNRAELDGRSGRFECVPPSKHNRGPVRVLNTFHFAYADQTPYFQIGTTCYAWIHQGSELEQQTLETLAASPFNKLRMCVFPKHYIYNQNEPERYPFEGTPREDWDLTRFNPEFFRHVEQRVLDLQKLGIEADVILLHPYDRWGFENMDAESDERYLRYVIARLAAFRNVWWSLANEFDFMKSKQEADWDRFFEIVRNEDPYDRLRSIHNGRRLYDHSKPWVTHVSLQSSDFSNAVEHRFRWQKPLIYDECKYEGDIPKGWGNISARQLVDNFWAGTISGCYVGHGETYKHPEDILWWSKGGVLHGQSASRIAFLKRIIEDVPFSKMEPIVLSPQAGLLAQPGRLYLVYFRKPGDVTVTLEGDQAYQVESIDTWNMTVSEQGRIDSGEASFTADTPGQLLRITAAADKP